MSCLISSCVANDKPPSTATLVFLGGGILVWVVLLIMPRLRPHTKPRFDTIARVIKAWGIKLLFSLLLCSKNVTTQESS
jgi:hypothetical protein